ncbi:kinase-like domain-containing protein, partial [Chlamydoabsidia padenii]
MLSTIKQEQQGQQQITTPFKDNQESKQEPTLDAQQPDPTPATKKPSTQSTPTTIDLGPNPDTLVFGIGEYQFVSQLGEGKFSKVMLARHYLTGDKFAIKMIDKRVFDDRVMSRLVREIGVMEALNHSNIARLYETFETTSTLYLVMEYIPGINLEEHLKTMGGSLTENDARLIFRQVVAAVDYCHQKWVVHRDLKAPNIILTKDNQVHLVDFGLSNRFGHQRLRTICGSMLYYSPEIINGKKYIGPEVDCWCLGICLFRMVAGFEAFVHAKTVGELRKDILNRNYPMPSHFSEGLKRTIQKCLTTDRRRRSSLGNALQGDPWLNDYGRFDDLFSDGQNYHAAMYQFALPSSMSHDTISLEARQQEREQQQQQYLRDMEQEKQMGYRVRKTIIHHAYNTSFYYT